MDDIPIEEIKAELPEIFARLGIEPIDPPDGTFPCPQAANDA